MASDCVSLGIFNLSGIPPAPRGVRQIEVTFDIDANGILNVTAKDLATSKEAKITITANTKLSKSEIDRLKKESDQFSEADKKKKEEAEVKNEADNLIYAAEKLVKQDLKDKIKPEHAEKINKSSQELRDAIASNNMDNIKTKTQELKNVLGEVSTEAYKVRRSSPLHLLLPCAAGETAGGAAAAGTGTSSEGFDSGAGSSGNSGGASPSDATQQQQEQPPRS